MAIIIPTISSCSEKITAGEKRLARLLEGGLSDDCTCWYDISMGEKHTHPDFVILTPNKGILFIEVKDWFVTKIKGANKTHIQYETKNGIESLKNPIEQVRQYTFDTINSLKKDPQLRQNEGQHQGNFIMPYGYGVYFTNITRAQLEKNFSASELNEILPPDQVICKDELNEFMSRENISSRLEMLVKHNFSHQTTPQQLNRIRWHLYPDVRINKSVTNVDVKSFTLHTPNIITIMDRQQEQLARSMGAGHRVIHGVAGSGKTLILLHRCIELANNIDNDKPILVICYNITLAKKLKALIDQHILRVPVEVTHFHLWCHKQLRHHRLLPPQGKNFIDLMEVALSQAFEKGIIQSEQYSAVLIDEGHDFKPEWLKILARMPDSKDNALLFLYDDAQSIYQKKKALDFTLSSVDIKAQGRTTILNTNYRNTQQILHFASSIAFNYLNNHIDDTLKYQQPDAGGVPGNYPALACFDNQDEEITHVLNWVIEQRQQGIAWSEIAILCPSTFSISGALGPRLAARNIPFKMIVSGEDKKHWSPQTDNLCVMPLPSSKGLEFESVVIMDAAKERDDTDLSEDIKRLYVGITRARHNLLVTMHGNGTLYDHLIETYEQSYKFI
ncbi:restriction endonuclease [Leclercia sp. LSNIH3]|uniref:DEAD/DEAH box helicase n=1 Tax=Leclercia sp. LSNIH3 TaxID=1920116 RepID=UPI000CDC1DCF|nr:nuclease-related domain-containing DEAD/DEAH box helicase [Leclercia sp. LSNIH3]AUY38883.1 restriction endonuclease [Leclercia sp. LSNIH3]POW70979.1 restriction endonuclease [Leclercia sp. LSNIH4]